MATPLRAFLHACFHASLAYRDALLGLWSAGDSVMKDAARFIEVGQDALDEQCRILLARIDLFPHRQRPRCSGKLKMDILRYRERFELPVAVVAQDVARSRSTLYRWIKKRQAVPSLDSPHKSTPPSRRIADVVRDFIRDMDRAGFPGNGSIAGALRSMGVLVSERSAGRMRREPLPPKRIWKNKTTAKRSRKRRDVTYKVRLVQRKPRLARLVKAFREAREVFALHFGNTIAGFRSLHRETRTRKIDARTLERSRRSEQLRILRDYLGCIGPRARPRYTPDLRADILAFKYRHGLSHERTARRFLIDPGTVCCWNVRADEKPTPDLLKTTLLSSQQAIKRVIRLVAPRLKDKLCARLLAVLLTIAQDIPGRRVIARRSNEKRAAIHRAARKTRGPLIARRHNHFWMGDFTIFSRIGRPDLYLATIIDVFSRRTLAKRLFVGEPSSEDMAALLREAIARHGKPRYFVSDQGPQFQGDAFQLALDEIGCDHREGAVGEKGTIAIIERLWKTVREALDIHNCPPLIPDLLAERIGVVLDWYDHFRPHQSLDNATPDEIFTGAHSPAKSAKPAPRGLPGEVTRPLGIVIRFALERERRLPYLERVS